MMKPQILARTCLVALIFLLSQRIVNGQQWNNSGNNYTTGKLGLGINNNPPTTQLEVAGMGTGLFRNTNYSTNGYVEGAVNIFRNNEDGIANTVLNLGNYFNTNSPNNSLLAIDFRSGDGGGMMGGAANPTGRIKVQTSWVAPFMDFDLAGKTIMRLQDNGNVGIGTFTNLQYKLVVYGSGANGIQIRNSNEPEPTWGLKLVQKDDLSGEISCSGQDLQLTSGWNKKLILGSPEYSGSGGKVVIPGGNFGIRTTNPLYPLHVIGATRFEGDIFIGSGVETKNKIAGHGYSGAIEIKSNAAVGGSEARYLRLGMQDNVGNMFPSISIIDNGNVGIGILNPQAKLDVNGSTKLVNLEGRTLMIERDDADSWLTFHDPGNSWYSMGIDQSDGGKFKLNWGGEPGFENVSHFIMTSEGNIGMGVNNPGRYKLNVWGPIRAHEIKVNTTGADFVFENNYKLRPLSEVEQFINDNNHLPEIPSAKEMQADGVGVGELQTKLLQKIEELTLYMIEQSKTVGQLKQENELQAQRLETLKKENEEIKKLLNK